MEGINSIPVTLDFILWAVGGYANFLSSRESWSRICVRKINMTIMGRGRSEVFRKFSQQSRLEMLEACTGGVAIGIGNWELSHWRSHKFSERSLPF